MNTKSEAVVKLRALEPEDLELLYQIENDRDLWDVGTANVPYSRFMLNDYIIKASGDIYTDKQVRLVVEDGQGSTIGLTDIFNFDPKHRRAEVGLVIKKALRGKGYGHAALSQLMTYARQYLLLHSAYAFVAVDNQASLTVFQQCGFRQVAVLDQWLYDGKAYHAAVMFQLLLD